MSQFSAEQMAQFDRYYHLLQSLPIPLYVTDLNKRILFINRAMEGFVAHPLSAYKGQPCARFGTELCGTEQCSIERLLRGEPHTRLTHNGHAYEIECCHLQDEAGANIGFLCLVEDASAQQDKEELFRQLADTIPGGVCEVALDDAFTLVYGNQGYYRLYGYTQQEMEQVLHNRLIDAIHPDDVPRIREIVETAYREGKRPFEFEKRVFTKNGKMVWMLARGAFLERPSGPVMSCVIIDITDRKLTEQQLKISDEQYRIALAQTDATMWEYDVQKRTIHQSQAARDMYGLEEWAVNVPDSLLEARVIHPDSAAEFRRFFQAIDDGEKKTTSTVKARKANGEYGWTRVTATSIFDDAGRPVKAIGVSEDITDVKTAEMRSLQEGQYRKALMSDALASFEVDFTTGQLLRCDENALDKLSLPEGCSYQQLRMRTADKCILQEDRDAFFRFSEPAAVQKDYQNGRRERRMEHLCRGLTDRTLWVLDTINMIENPLDGHICGFIYLKDIDEKKKSELALQEKAERDPVTKLYNRFTTQSMIERMLRRDQGAQSALLMLDIDNFKLVNDAYGHAYGDEVLFRAAQKLNSLMHPDDVIGRIGGDEFIVFLHEVEQRDLVYQTAANICREMHLAYGQDEESEVQLSCSVGIAFSPEHGTEFQPLYEKADAALYQAKRRGKNQYAEYGVDQTLTKAAAWMNKEWLIDELDEIVYVSDLETYDVLYLNRACRKVTGVGEGRYDGQKCYKLLQGRDEPCPFCTNAKLRADEFYVWEFSNDYIHRHFIIKDKLVEWEGRRARMEFAIDITEKENISQNIELKLEIENALLNCINQLVTTENLDDAVTTVLKSIGEFYQADRAYIFEIDPAEQTCNNTYEWTRPGVSPQIESLQGVPLAWIERWMESFERGEAIIINDLETVKGQGPEQEFDVLNMQEIKSLYAVPFTIEKDLVGFIGVDNPRAYSQDISLLDSLSYFIINQITKRRMQAEMAFNIYHDALTGLPNRNQYVLTLRDLEKQDLKSCGACVADINGLKQVNRQFGHTSGDVLIRDIADLMRGHFAGDGVFRLSGDEFVILSVNTDRKTFLDRVNALKKSIAKMENDGVSLGFTWTDEEINLPVLVEHADELMFIEKQQYYKESEAVSKHRSPRIAGLLSALENGVFFLYLQPKVEISSGRIVGAEALVRGNDPYYGFLQPGRFIPILEKERIIRYIDFFMYEQVCQLLERWQREGRPMIPIALNFSRVTLLESDLIDILVHIHEKYDVPRALIEIEITESIGEMERETIADIGIELRRMGFRVALDDFGSKYTSMSLLSVVQFDVLKLDRSLITSLAANRTSRLIVQHTIGLCRDIGVQCVAEGVETEEQFAILNEMGCDVAQGYLFSKPIDVSAFEKSWK